MNVISRPLAALLAGIGLLSILFGLELCYVATPDTVLAAATAKLVVVVVVVVCSILCVGLLGTRWLHVPPAVPVILGCGLFVLVAVLGWQSIQQEASLYLAYSAGQLAILAALIWLSRVLANALSQVNDAVGSPVPGIGSATDAAMERVNEQLAQCRRHQRPLSVMLVDAKVGQAADLRKLAGGVSNDHNKYVTEIAERLSHHMASKSLARLIKSELRQSDIMLWRGIDEQIVIVCPDTNDFEMNLFIDRLRGEVNYRLGTEVAFGSATFPDEALTCEDLLLAALADCQRNREERRSWPRYAARQGLNIALNFGGKEIACVVIEVSLGGARLQQLGSGSPHGLTSDSEVRLGEADALCVWTDAKGIGIQFELSEQALTFVSRCLASTMPELQSIAHTTDYDNVVAMESGR